MNRLAGIVGSILLLVLLADAQISDPYDDALRYFELGRYDQAITTLKTILNRDPECIECYDLLARIATSQRNDSLAAVWYRQALAVEPENATLYRKLGVAEHSFGDLLQAIADLEYSLQLNPFSGETNFELGNVWYDLKEYYQARMSYVQALALDSTVAMYHFQLGMVFFQTAQLDSALTEFQSAYLDSALTECQSAYRLYPKYSQAYELAANILVRRGSWAQVIDVLERGLANASETSVTRLWLGRAHLEMGNFLRAAELLRGYVGENPNNVTGKYNYGLALYEIGEYKEAVEQLRFITLQMPNHQKARLYLGRSYNALDQDSLAYTAFDALLSIDSTYYEAWIYRGDVDLKRDRYADAMTCYERAAQLWPDRWEAYHRQGLTRYIQGRYAEAEMLLFSAYVRDTVFYTINDSDTVRQAGNTVIYYLMGDITAAMGEDDWSVYYYSTTLRFEPENTAVRNKLISALVRRQLWSQARDQLLWFYNRDPLNEAVLYQLGRVAYAGGDTAAARKYMDRFQQLHTTRRERELLELRISLDRRNPVHFVEMGWYYRRQENYSRARDYFRQAVALGDTTLPASLYMDQGTGP